MVVVGVMTGGVFWFWHMMGAPLYQPGIVRAGENLRGPLSPPPQPKDPNIWKVEEDIELHHFSHGKGLPVLFVHGGPGFPVRDLPAGLQRLASGCEIHFYDQRGCGRSTKPFDGFSSRNFYQSMLTLDRTLGIGAQIADIERIRQILGQEKLILIGHSFGGFLAGLYAAEFPERVEAVVLVTPADMLVMPSKNDLFKLIRERLPDNAKEEFERFLSEYMDFSNVFKKNEENLAALNRDFAKFFLQAGNDDPSAGIAELSEVGNGGWMVTAMYFGLGKRHDYRDALRRVSAPVLIVHGDGDLAPISVSRQYADLLAHARLEIIPGAGHFVIEEKPIQFSKIASAFLKDVCGSKYNPSGR